MYRSIALILTVGGVAPLFAADVTAGMEKAATCAACHKPLAGDSYVFSLKQLSQKARASQ